MSTSTGHVAVTGASGLIGRHLRLALGDRPVTLLGRGRLDTLPNEHWAPFDLAGPVELPHLPPESTLCHLAYAMTDGRRNLDYTQRAIDAVNRSNSIDHVVMLSSASVYGAATTGLIDEETPLRPDSDYALTKAACERSWAETLRPDCRLTVLRPTSIVASDGPAIDALARDAVHYPWRGFVKRSLQHRNTVHFVAVDTVVGAVCFVLDRAGASREVFIVADDDAPQNASYAAAQDFIRSCQGRGPLRAPALPKWLERPLGAVIGKPLGVRRRFSSARLADAGCAVRIPVGETLADTVDKRF